MNPVHDSKDWRNSNGFNGQAPLQTPPIALADQSSSPKLGHANNGYSSPVMECPAQNGVYLPQQQNLQQGYVSSPTEATTSTNRLPGMIAHSQPSTPRPENSQQQDASLYQQSAPFATRTVVRGRANLFANETGPYFSSTKPFDNLYSSDKSTLLSVRVQSKMDRGFFMADNDWTCYRRNYFQVSSVFSVHGFNHYYSVNEPHVFVKTDEEGILQPVQRFLLGVSARVANSEKEIELIQHTPKRDKGPQFKPEPKPIAPGGNLTMSSVANNQNIVTFERVQFKTATANNGKRRAAQQYYICVIELFAETDRGQTVKIASCQSAPLVVRGRSPGHYADNQQHERPHIYTTTTAAASAAAPTTAAGNAISSTNSEPMTPQPTLPLLQQQPQTPQDNRQQMFSSYNKPNTSQQQQEPQSMMQPGYEQQAPQGYSYYPPYPQYAHVQQQQQHQTPQQMSSNVSSPMSHPPLPSPYTHHTQLPTYGVHDGSPYTNDAVYQHHSNNGTPTTEEPKMHHSFHMQQTGPIESPHSGYDWQRGRYNSSSSGSSSVPSPGAQQGEAQQAYFGPDGNRSYSPTTPTYSPGVIQPLPPRKFNAAVKQQMA